MLEELFTWLTTAMSGSFGIALIAAAGWGVASILLSPCHLASIPLVIGFLTTQGAEGNRRPYALSFVFAVGILITIALIGIATALLGRMMGDVGVWGNLLVSIVFFVVGLYLLDVIPLNWGELIPLTTRWRGWKGALVLGLIFGIGLGPCTFAYMAPVLAVVFTVGSTDPAQAALLVASFGLGHCAIIAGAGGTVGTLRRFLRWTDESKNLIRTKRIAGMLIIGAGAYYLTTLF